MYNSPEAPVEMIMANFLESEAATGREMYEAMKTVVMEK